MGFFDFFPYTNFHNVNLDWVLQRVKEWGELVEANNTAFHNLEEANASFKRYVETYLQNLDVQDEINIKLDDMLESGELAQYFQPYISASTSEWLEENITEPTGVIIDRSLTVSGACADAKETGTRISDIFTNNAKRLLLNSLQNMAFLSADSNMLYSNLQISLFYGDVFNKWHYSLTDGDLIMTHRSVNPNADSAMYPSRISMAQSENRRNMSVNYGITPYYLQEVSSVPTPYFPIPIPQTANKFTINMTPNSQFIYLHICPYNPVRNWYENSMPANVTQWTQMLQPLTKDIIRTDNSQLFMSINLKYNTAGNTYPTNPQTFTIDFSV